MRNFLISFAVTLIFMTLKAQASQWIVNEDHSSVWFRVPYLGLSEVNGRFNKFSGKSDFDDKTNNPMDLFFSVRASSIDTGNRMRDGHLRSNDFLKVNQFPDVLFKSQKITPMGGSKYLVWGDLTLRGITKRVEVKLQVTTSVKDTWGYENRFATFNASINREDFGVRWNKSLGQGGALVGEKVTLWGTLQLQPTSGLTPTTNHMIPDTLYIRDREKLMRGELTEKEFKKKYERVVKIEGSTASSLERRRPEVCPQVVAKDRKNTLWWISFLTLGLFGFFASIIISLYWKKRLLVFLGNKYEENGVMGNLSDLTVVIIVMIYSMAFWYVGWGH